MKKRLIGWTTFLTLSLQDHFESWSVSEAARAEELEVLGVLVEQPDERRVPRRVEPPQRLRPRQHLGLN